MRTSDGSPACAACTHVLVPANGTFAFALDPGVYRIVLETTDFYATVGVSATFTINIVTTTTSTTSTTTTTTLPVFPVASNTVWNAYGEMVVLDDAFRSGFRMATGDAAATPIVARAAVGRVNEAVIFTPSTDTIRGVLSTPAVGLRFWAKVTTGVDVSVYALVGGSAAGMVSVSGDGQWAEYRLGFGYTRPVGQEVILLGNATGTATLLLDDMGFIIPPPLPPPTTATTTPAPTGHYESRVVLDWRNQLDCLSFQNIDGTGPIDYQCSFSTVEGSPPDFGWFNSPVTAENTVLASGATADDPYHLASYHTFTKMKTIQVWIEGPPTTTVPPPTLYPDWGVTFRQYGSIPPGNDTFSFETRFGNPPAVLFQNFTVGAGALQTVLSTGAIGDNPPYGNTFTHYTTVAPTTTTPPPTTTTTVVVTTTTIPTKPAAFSSYPNYLKSQLTGTCLTVGGLAGCDSGSQQLLLSAFPAAGGTNGYLVKQGSDCLTVNYDAPPDSQVQLPDSSYALKIDWLPCNSQSGGDTDWIPELADGSTGTDWFILMPRYNHPGIADPCLNLNTNPSSPQMLIEYTCHRQTTSTEEHWAPSESFWVAPATVTTTTTTTTVVTSGGTTTTTTTPGGLPSGTHTIESGTVTPFEQFIDGNLTCVTLDGGSYKMLAEPADCLEFQPILIAGGFRFQHVLDPSACIATSASYTVVKGTCTGNDSVWNDEYVSTPLMGFVLRCGR